MANKNARRQNVSASNHLLPGPAQPTRGPLAVTASDLEAAISSYESALDGLPKERDATAQTRVMEALLARDRLGKELSTVGGLLGRETLSRVVEQDERLKSSTELLVEIVGDSAFAGWRETLRPPDNAWWWSLDMRAEASHEGNGIGPQLFRGFLITVAIALSAEIFQRFMSGGPDLIGILSALVQTFLALVAGSSFTQYGSQVLERTFSRWAVRPRLRPRWKLKLALAFLGLTLALRLSLPAVAKLYHWRGSALFERQDPLGAVQNFKRAVALDPASSELHADLAVAYEEFLDHEQAIREYEIARSLGSSDPRVFNNLARLYLRREDYKGALRLLEQAERQAGPKDSRFEYAFHKNRGWARLGLELYQQARSDLEQALTLNEHPAEAHCLLAQLLEKQKASQALGHWENCLAHHDLEFEPVDATWLETARARVHEHAGASP